MHQKKVWSTDPCMARWRNAGFPGSRGSLLKALRAAYCRLLRVFDYRYENKTSTTAISWLHQLYVRFHCTAILMADLHNVWTESNEYSQFYMQHKYMDLLSKRLSSMVNFLKTPSTVNKNCNSDWITLSFMEVNWICH